MQEEPSPLTRKVAKITFQTAILGDKSKLLFDGAVPIKRRVLNDVLFGLLDYRVVSRVPLLVIYFGGMLKKRVGKKGGSGKMAQKIFLPVAAHASSQ